MSAQPSLALALGLDLLIGVDRERRKGRGPTRRFAGIRTLSAQELRDALVLAGSALIILPLAPNQPLAWLGGVNPRTVWLLVVPIMGVQALGHVALRLFGATVSLGLLVVAVAAWLPWVGGMRGT